jgi:type II secretory pathway predicted ATPase ExeA
MNQRVQTLLFAFHPGPLDKGELASYIAHRMTAAGRQSQWQHPIIAPGLLPALYRASRGVPRVVNVLCTVRCWAPM